MSASLVDGAYNSLMSRPAVKMFLQSWRRGVADISLQRHLSRSASITVDYVFSGSWLANIMIHYC